MANQLFLSNLTRLLHVTGGLSRRVLALLVFVLLGTGLAASDKLSFLDLVVKPIDGNLLISGEPVGLISYQVLDDETYDITPEMRASLDAPFQFAIEVLEELDQKRSATILDPNIPLDLVDPVSRNLARLKERTFFIVNFEFSIAIRNMKGQKIDSEKTRVSVGLHKTPGNIFVSKNRKKGWHTSFASLKNENTYREFLRKLVFPYGEASFHKPKQEEFLVDLYYRCHFVRPKLDEHFGLESSRNQYKVLSRLFRHNRMEQLGITACFQKGQELVEVRNGHLKFLKQIFDEFQSSLEKTQAGTISLAEMESLAARAPAEPNILALLIEAYIKEGLIDEAYDRMVRLWPIVEKTPRLARLFSKVEKNKHLAQRQFLERRTHFPKATGVSLNIVTPSALDFVGGDTDVIFTLGNAQSDLVQAELFVNRNLVDILVNPSGPSFRFNFKAAKMRRNVGLRIKAYFKDETYLEKAIPVRTINLNDEETIQLISLRTVAVRGKHKLLVDLNADDFSIHEGKSRREIVSFKKDTAPLQVAILIDTSSSMGGEKLYHAQYAVNQFLTHLEPKDNSAVYTFDDKVLRFSHYTNQIERLRPLLFTLRPHLSTSLYDALTVAQNDLRDKEGTQVIIVVSDGSDSSSTVTADKIMPILHNTNVVVYSIILGRNEGMDKLGARFLTKLSQITGSITTEVAEIGDLKLAFKRIYDELKAFYFIDFYSNQTAFSLEKVDLEVKKMNTRARYRQHLTFEQTQVGTGYLEQVSVPTILKVDNED